MYVHAFIQEWVNSSVPGIENCTENKLCWIDDNNITWTEVSESVKIKCK